MNSVTMMANVVGVIVVIFVAIAFITLAIFYLKAQKKLITHGLEDDAIRTDVRAMLEKSKEEYSTFPQAQDYFARKKKRETVLQRVMWGVCIAFCLAVVVFLIFSGAVGGNRHIWLGDRAVLTIQTGSMASVNPGNTYLTESDQRIEQYSLITISKKQEYIDKIQVGDIVAFSMESEGEQITVIHRLIEIGENASGAPVYTFRGDANPSSMAGEFQIGKERIVGVFATADFQGTKNVALGHFISYIRSSVGVSTTVMALGVLILYMLLNDGVEKLYLERFDRFQWEILEQTLPAQEEIIAQEATTEAPVQQIPTEQAPEEQTPEEQTPEEQTPENTGEEDASAEESGL